MNIMTNSKSRSGANVATMITITNCMYTVLHLTMQLHMYYIVNNSLTVINRSTKDKNPAAVVIVVVLVLYITSGDIMADAVVVVCGVFVVVQ